MRRRDLSKILFASASGTALVAGTAEAQSCTPACYAQIPQESVPPLNPSYPPGDIRRYGATTTASDNRAAIQQALDVSASGGPSAYIPAGQWTITATVTAGGDSSLRGEGRKSVLKAKGCHAITFANQESGGGARSFRDFAIVGENTAAFSGIHCNLDSVAGRITGILFESIYIENFGTGVYARGMWNCSFIRCFLFNNFTGIYLFQRSIDTTILNTAIIKYPPDSGLTGTRGILTGEADSLRPEDVRILGSFVYGHEVNVDLSRQLYSSIIDCDLDAGQRTGVRLTQIDGGCTVRDNWIATDNSNVATMGIEIVPLGTARNSNVAVENNHIVCNSPATGSVGIKNGFNQNMVRIVGNRITGFHDGIYNNGGSRLAASGNSINVSNFAVFLYTASGSEDCEIGANFVESGNSLTFSAATPPRLRYVGNGSFVATLTGCTSVPSGTVQYYANGSSVRLRTPDIVGGSNPNSTAASLVGIPNNIRPRVNQTVLARVMDNGQSAFAAVVVRTDGTVLLTKDANGSAFSSSGTKGVTACEIEYLLDA